MKTGKIGHKEIQIIHIAKNQLMLKEKDYRTLLKSFGVTSSKDLTFAQYERLLRKFQAEGFILTSKKKLASLNCSAPWEKEPMLKKIGALLTTMDLNWHYADGIARQMFKVDTALWCTPKQLHGIIAALEYKSKRVAT